MRITTLMENTAAAPGIASEHGLSLYIESNGHKILFDMGQSGAFADNAKLLGVDLSTVDIAILSHGHYDHGGGVLRFFAENGHAPLYVSRLAFAPHYNGTEKYIGLNPAIGESRRLVLTGPEDVKLGDGLTIRKLSADACQYPSYGQGLNVKVGDGFLTDTFLHEQYLEIAEGEKRVLVSGCSHRGVLNIVREFAPDVLVGGMHVMKLEPGGRELARLGELLGEMQTMYYTCHCTGEMQYTVLKKKMGRRLSYLAAGETIEI